MERAVSASSGNTQKVWDVERDRELRTLVRQSSYVNGVAPTADGKRALSASSDNMLKVWDVDSGALIATLHCDGTALCCAFVNARRILADDLGVRLYSLSLEGLVSRIDQSACRMPTRVALRNKKTRIFSIFCHDRAFSWLTG